MTDATVVPAESSSRFHFDWISTIIFRPRQAFTRIVNQGTGVWLTPMLVLTLTALLQVWAAGSIRQAAAASGQMTLPPDYQYYTPDMQAQWQQAASATSSPVFIYVFPAIVALSRVWLGWLVIGGLLHLVLTLLGGRGIPGGALNIVAWASIPYAIRDLVRAISMWNSHQLVSSPGISGFVAADGTSTSLFLVALMSLVDIYLIWNIILLIIGVRTGDGLSRGKAVGGVLITMLIVLIFQVLLAFGTAKLGSLSVVRPFFF